MKRVRPSQDLRFGDIGVDPVASWTARKAEPGRLVAANSRLSYAGNAGMFGVGGCDKMATSQFISVVVAGVLFSFSDIRIRTFHSLVFLSDTRQATIDGLGHPPHKRRLLL